MDIDNAPAAEHCACGIALVLNGSRFVGADTTRACRLGGGHRAPRRATSAILDAVFGDDGRDDALTTALRASGH